MKRLAEIQRLKSEKGRALAVIKSANEKLSELESKRK